MKTLFTLLLALITIGTGWSEDRYKLEIRQISYSGEWPDQKTMDLLVDRHDSRVGEPIDLTLIPGKQSIVENWKPAVSMTVDSSSGKVMGTEPKQIGASFKATLTLSKLQNAEVAWEWNRVTEEPPSISLRDGKRFITSTFPTKNLAQKLSFSPGDPSWFCFSIEQAPVASTPPGLLPQPRRFIALRLIKLTGNEGTTPAAANTPQRPEGLVIGYQLPP